MHAFKEQVPAASDDFGAFAVELNNALRKVAGVSYAEVARQIHPDMIAPREAWGDGMSPGAFAEHVVMQEGFVTTTGAGSESYARDMNLRKAAIAEFAYSQPDWHRTADGRYFSQDGDVLLTIRPVYDRARDEVGFGIEAYEGFVMSSDGTDIVDGGHLIARGAADDIGGAFTELRADLHRRSAPSA